MPKRDPWKTAFKPRTMSEAQIQAGIVAYLRVSFDGLFYHVPNGGAALGYVSGPLRDNIRKKMARTGERAGVPDLCLHWWDDDLRMPKTAYFEVKAGKGKQTEAQEKWQFHLRAMGINCEVVRSVDEVQKWLTEWRAPIRGKIV